jgi:hypothetical protein
MKKETLFKIARLTDFNHHGEARLLIASSYNYLTKEKEILLAINRIHSIEGHLPFYLHGYREEITNRILKAIEEKEGKEEVKALCQAI